MKLVNLVKVKLPRHGEIVFDPKQRKDLEFTRHTFPNTGDHYSINSISVLGDRNCVL